MSTRVAPCPDVRDPLQRLRRSRRGPVVFLALLAYLLTGAAVPQGHMAASVGSGTPFHLCPGDLRSAQILDALATAEDGGAGGHAHHGHDADHGKAAAGLADAPAAKSTADPGCAFAAGGVALAAADGTVLPDPVAAPAVPPSRGTAPAGRSWLRPPARSPPA